MPTLDLEPELSRFEATVIHHEVQNGDVALHYASIGAGPLVVFLHGFPDHWLTWWRQMEALSKTHRCVAMDLRGYNLSGQPEDAAAYDPEVLVSDVRAVIDDCGEQSAIVIGHDWGGFVAWQTAMLAPEKVARLGIVNMPHPGAIARELAINPAQEAASAYVRLFQTPGAEAGLDFDHLSGWIHDAAFRKRHDQAMAASKPVAMLNYYRACFPVQPYEVRSEAPPPVRVPTLAIHGLEDPYSLPAGLNDLWGWVASDLTIKAWPGVGHFVQQDVPERLTQTLQHWLTA